MRQCVICKSSFDEREVTHLPDRPHADRWTCSTVCQKRLELRRKVKADDHAAARAEARDDLVDDASEAEVARAALARMDEFEDPVGDEDEGDDLAELVPGDSTPAECMRAGGALATAAAGLSGPEDAAVVLGLAIGFMARARMALESSIGAGGPDAHAPEERPVAPPPRAPPVSRTWPVPSETGKGTYQVTAVTRTPGNVAWSCTCKGFEFGSGKRCKHISRVISRARS